MFCSKTLIHRVSKLHERALRITYDDYLSDFKALFAKNDTVTVNKRNLNTLAIEV